jgi:hypothetical protein
MKKMVLGILFLVTAWPLTALAQAPGAAAALTPTADASAAPAASVAVVGVYERGSVVLAFYRSPLWEAILADQRFEMNAAKADKDEARIKVLEKWGGNRQEQAMQQVFSNEPIDNVLAVLQPEFKELSAKLKLAKIVDSSAADPHAATVDVTPLLMDWLKASAETRKMAVEMHQKQSGAK